MDKIPSYMILSLYQHFKNSLVNENVRVEFEPMTADVGTSFTLRTNGPDKILSNNTVRYQVSVNIGLRVKIENTRPHLYAQKVAAGLNAFVNCIPVKNYGDGTDTIGAMYATGPVQTLNYGLIEPAGRMTLTTFEATYYYEV